MTNGELVLFCSWYRWLKDTHGYQCASSWNTIQCMWRTDQNGFSSGLEDA